MAMLTPSDSPFETELDVMGWIRGSCSPADVGTKPNSPLTEPVVLMFATGKISIDFSSCESRSSEHRLGSKGSIMGNPL